VKPGRPLGELAGAGAMSASASATPLVTFLSDYGLSDEYVGVCHGVIARLCPRARVLDITHEIPRQDVRAGALALAAAVPFMPPAVHLAVVDPGVGATGLAARRPVALRATEAGQFLVGPDNGLLLPAAGRLGGVARAVDIKRSPQRLSVVSQTFHGRDLFAPVAAALAAGLPLEQVGEPIRVDSLHALELPYALVRDGELRAHVLHSDHFGNLILDATAAQLVEFRAPAGAQIVVVHNGVALPARRARTYADVARGELLLYEDAQGRVALAVNLGSARQLLDAQRDDELVVRTA
jgi:S-adenosyl-L-methionine hydrolase (adenosine-forming)